MVDRALVEVLIGADLVAVLVADAHQEEAALAAVDGDLPDGFVEALLEELFADGAESYFSGLALQESLFEFFVELYDFYFGGGGGEYGLYPELSVIGAVFFGGEYLAEYVFGVVLFVFFLGFGVVGGFGGAAHEDGGGVFY